MINRSGEVIDGPIDGMYEVNYKRIATCNCGLLVTLWQKIRNISVNLRY